MKYKPSLKLPLIASLVFLLIISIIAIFIFIISIKPVKLNFLNYFDRESSILKKHNVSEIGDVFLSFNKITRNFEILIENLVIKKSYFPSILVGVDFVFDKKIYETSLQIFDGDVEISYPSKKNDYSKEYLVINKLKENFSLFQNFSEIQIVNTKLNIFLNEDNLKSYKLDLNKKKNSLKFLLSEESVKENFISVNYNNSENKKDIRLEIDKFNFDFLKYLFNFQNIFSNELYLTGSSRLIFNEDLSVDKINFKLDLDGDISYSTFRGIEKINFNQSSIFGEKYEDNLDIILNFSHKMSDLKSVLRLNLNDKIKSKTFFQVDTIDVNKLLEMWPRNFKESVYLWMTENSSGKIFNLSVSNEIFDKNKNIKFTNLKGAFDFKDTTIKYMDSMPMIQKINGNAKINNGKVIFYVSSGESNNVVVQSGVIELYDLNSDLEKANVNLNLIGKNYDVINYLDISPINKKSYSKLRSITGRSSINLELDFPLIIDLPAEDIRYKAHAKIENSLFNNLIKNINLENFYLEIKINNSEINYNGSGNLSGSKTEFAGKQSFANNKFLDEINGSFLLSSKFAKFLFPNYDFDYKGEILINYIINEDDTGFSKVEAMGDLSNLQLTSTFLGPDLNFKNGKIRFLIRPYDKLFSGFFDIKSNNLEVEVNALFSSDHIIDVDIQKFITPIQDFKFKYQAKSNDFKLSGNILTLDKVRIFENREFESENFNFELDVNDLYLSGMHFMTSDININKSDGVFKKIKIEVKGNEDFHNISLKKNVKDKKFVLESNYLPGLLNIFDLDLNIKKGSLKIEGIQTLGTGDYVGEIAGANLVFYDAPFLANFFSIFSLDGFAQKLKDGGIIFNKFNADYKLENNRLKIVDSLLKGSELGIQFDSVIGMNDDYFLLNGSIIPAYTINTLITKFPIVGDIVTAGSPEDGLVGANFRVEKIDGDYEIFYNPISVFVPNIIKNFLSD